MSVEGGEVGGAPVFGRWGGRGLLAPLALEEGEFGDVGARRGRGHAIGRGGEAS